MHATRDAGDLRGDTGYWSCIATGGGQELRARRTRGRMAYRAELGWIRPIGRLDRSTRCNGGPPVLDVARR